MAETPLYRFASTKRAKRGDPVITIQLGQGNLPDDARVLTVTAAAQLRDHLTRALRFAQAAPSSRTRRPADSLRREIGAAIDHPTSD